MPFQPFNRRTASRRSSCWQQKLMVLGGLNTAGESGGQFLVRPADCVFQIEPQRRIHGLHVDVAQLDEIAQPALESSLNGELHGRCELRAVWREYEWEQSAAEIWPVHSLARIRENELLDHVADVISLVCRRSPPAAVK